MKLRSATTALMLSAAAFLTPGALQAQFTTFVVPPHKAPADTAKPATVAQVKAKNDSIAKMSITNMKEWVDSAAGVNTTVASVPDSTMASASASSATAAPAATSPSNTRGRSTTAFSNGAIAPNTASPLPVYLATGFLSFAAGLMLFGLRRRTAMVRRKVDR